MKLISKNGDTIRLEMTHEEFNIIRETNSTALISTTKEEAIEMIGLDKDQLSEFGDSIIKLADENGIEL